MKRITLKFDSFEGGATHYCKHCDKFCTPRDYTKYTTCPHCGRPDFLMPNPFPDNMIPYIEVEGNEV